MSYPCKCHETGKVCGGCAASLDTPKREPLDRQSWIDSYIEALHSQCSGCGNDVRYRACTCKPKLTRQAYDRDEGSYIVIIDNVRYIRTNGFGSPLAEVVDFGIAFAPNGRVIPSDDPRHPDEPS